MTDTPSSEIMLGDLASHPNFQVTWTNRRRLINRSLLFCCVIVSIVLFLCTLGILIGRDIPTNVANVFSTMISSVVFFSLAIIGSYVFGKSWETNNFREKITDLATVVMKK